MISMYPGLWLCLIDLEARVKQNCKVILSHASEVTLGNAIKIHDVKKN